MSIMPSPISGLDHQRCRFSSATGRRCRMPRSQFHPAFCFPHARALDGYGLYLCPPAKQPSSPAAPAETPDFGAELLPSSGEFRTATEINRALGSVFLLLAQNRIPRRNAVALAYIAQLLLQTLPGVREELTRCLGHKAWEETLDDVFPEDPAGEANPEPVAAETNVSTKAEAEPEAKAEADREPSLVQSSAESAPEHDPNFAHPCLERPISTLASCAVSETQLEASPLIDECQTQEQPSPDDDGATRTPPPTTAAAHAWPLSILRLAKIRGIPRSRWRELYAGLGKRIHGQQSVSPAESAHPESV